MPDSIESLIAGLFVRTFLYGVYLTILAHCLRWLFFEDEGWILRPRLNRLMLTATTLVFGLTTGNIGIWFYRTFNAIRHTTSATDHTFILAGNVLENATTLLVDGILIYRCWLVYAESWRAIFLPLVFWLSNIGLFICYSYKSSIGIHERLLPVSLYSCNIAINLYATSAIIYQILRVTKRSNTGSDLLEACHDLVQCGLPYLFTNVFSLAIMARQPKGLVFPLSCAMNSVICAIAFNLILIRAGLHRTDPQIHEFSNEWKSASLRFAVPHATGEDCVGHSETGEIFLEKLP